MTTTSVKPRRHVQGNISFIHRIMHNNIVGRKHFVNIVYRHRFWKACSSAGTKTQNFIVNMMTKINFRLFIIKIFHKLFVRNMIFRNSHTFNIICHYKKLRLPKTYFFDFRYNAGNTCRINNNFRFVMIYKKCHFTAGKIIVSRQKNSPDFSRTSIKKGKFRRIP